ncbi:MAG: peroxidase-related enzyme [Sphingobacteriales bacterium]|nr:peroxidase-related enzyme [Sphingobacteriales bacterium]
MARIKVIQPEDATGALHTIYHDAIEKRGRLAEVLKIQSLHPDSIRSHMNFYMDIMFSKTSLTRAEKEMIAVVVSATNGCVYCQTHHAEALNHYWKDEERIEQLKADFKKAKLSFREEALCAFAIHLTQNPQEHESSDHTIILKTAGINDEGVLDAALVTSYFNFVNRMVLSLGVQLEDRLGKGYKY